MNGLKLTLNFANLLTCAWRRTLPLHAPGNAAVKKQGERFFGAFDKFDGNRAANILVQLVPLATVVAGQKNLFYAVANSGKEFFFEAAYGQHPPGEGQFPGHGDAGAQRLLAKG